MCMVSYIGDDWAKRGAGDWPWANPVIPDTNIPPGIYHPPGVSREEFEKLEKEMKALKELIKAAKKYDEETGQPDCEIDDKVELIRRMAEMVGVDMEDVFDPE